MFLEIHLWCDIFATEMLQIVFSSNYGNLRILPQNFPDVKLFFETSCIAQIYQTVGHVINKTNDRSIIILSVILFVVLLIEICKYLIKKLFQIIKHLKLSHFSRFHQIYSFHVKSKFVENSPTKKQI